VILLDAIKTRFSLNKLELLEWHPNAFEGKVYGYVSGYRNFFTPVYASRTHYQRVFRWQTHSGQIFLVAIEPVVCYNEGYPVEDVHSVAEKLCNHIKESLNTNVTQR